MIEANDKNVLISVIVPIYGVEAYLDRCVESIVQQSYENLEILLVDDESPDACPAICDRWETQDDRIIAIHKKHGGLSDARNCGIEAAKGEWLMFIDSDDYIAPSMCETLLAAARSMQMKLVMCNSFECADGSITPAKCRVPDLPCVLTGKEVLRHYMANGGTPFNVSWNKLYHRSLFFTKPFLRFAYGRLYEDGYMNYRLYYRMDSIAILPDCLYYHVKRPGSITQSPNEQSVIDLIDCAKERLEWAQSEAPEFSSLMVYHAMQILFSSAALCAQNPGIDTDGTRRREFLSHLQKNHAFSWNNPHLRLKGRLKYILFRTHLYGVAFILYSKLRLAKRFVCTKGWLINHTTLLRDRIQ